MKKTVILSLLLILSLVLSACVPAAEPATSDTTAEPGTSDTTAEPGVTDTQTETDPAETTAPSGDTTGEPAPEDLREEFYAAHPGYWTEKENGRFITFQKNEEGVYRVTFAVWNAGGPFPSGEVKEVKKAGDGLYFLMITIDGMPDNPDWYGDGWDPYDVTVSVADGKTDPASFVCVAVGDSVQRTYFYHENPENPYLPQPDPVGDFVSKYKGYWTESDGCFIYISEDRRVNFSKWNTGGGSPSGSITEVTSDGKGAYTVKVAVDAFAGNEEIGGWEAYEFLIEFTDLGTKDPETAKANHPYFSGYQAYRHHTEPGDPFQKEKEDMIEDFYAKYNGYWSEKDGKFIFVSKSDRRIDFAVWNSGGAFPGGPIYDISKDESGMYTLQIHIPAMPDTDESSGWEAYDMILHFKDLGTSPMSASADHPFLTGFNTFYYHSNPGYPFKG